MPYASLEQHVAALGGVRPIPPRRAPAPFDGRALALIAACAGAPVPAALAWWWSRFGGGFELAVLCVYPDRAGEEMYLESFLDAAEVEQALDDADGRFAPGRFPILEDTFGNYVLVGADGVVYEDIHYGAPDPPERSVADSFEAFVLSWRIATDD